MIRCTVLDKEGYRFTRYLVVDAFRLLLVEPDVSRVGWGVVRQVSPLQHTLVTYFTLLLAGLGVGQSVPRFTKPCTPI